MFHQNYRHTAAFPDASISIEKFLKLCLLKPSFTNEDPGCLLIWPIPSRALIDNLKKSYGQAVLNGSKSVEDPRYPGSRLPLWYKMETITHLD
ncbi:hypothetical protein L208DRAFT_1398038 [Tricholoma matsutake]|nr:hypothetical protein L208DRAFT_1398038 [Tricholoma matsutake 945]